MTPLPERLDALLRALDRATRPGPRLVAFVVLASFALWPLAGLSPSDVVAALRADVALEAAVAEGDTAALAEAVETRMALPVAPRDANDLGAVAAVLHEGGATTDALAVAERALVLAAEQAGDGSLAVAMAANNLAWFLVSLDEPRPGELDRARALAKDAGAIAPGNPFFLGTLGTVELRRGDLEAARALLREAIAAHDPDALSATDRAILAIVLARQGDAVGARASIEAARAAGTPDPSWLARAERALSEAEGRP